MDAPAPYAAHEQRICRAAAVLQLKMLQHNAMGKAPVPRRQLHGRRRNEAGPPGDTHRISVQSWPETATNQRPTASVDGVTEY